MTNPDVRPYINFHDNSELEDYEIDYGYGVLNEALTKILVYAEINKCGFYKAIKDLHPNLPAEDIQGIQDLLSDKIDEMINERVLH